MIYAKQFEAELNLVKGAYEWYVTAHKFCSNEARHSKNDFKEKGVKMIYASRRKAGRKRSEGAY